MVLASRGQRDLDSGLEEVGEAEVRAALRRRAVVIVVQATVLALALTALAMLPR